MDEQGDILKVPKSTIPEVIKIVDREDHQCIEPSVKTLGWIQTWRG
jgi:hypothetical protein